jgi:hypothetical protein
MYADVRVGESCLVESYAPGVARQERGILQRAVRVVAEQAAKADALVDEASPASDPRDTTMHSDVGVRAWASRSEGGQSWSLTSSALGLDRGSRSSSRLFERVDVVCRLTSSGLEEALAVALTGRDVTIDLREVEKLGPEGITALSRASAILDGWDSGLLYLLVTRATPVWQELGASSLASAPRVYIDEVGSE